MSLDPKTSKQGKLKVCSQALHPEFSYPLIDVSELSIEKGYEPFNWLKPENKVTAMYLIEAAQRHLDQVKLGIDINTEEVKSDGTKCTIQPYHAAQVAYNMLMLVMQLQKGVCVDDRQFKEREIRHKQHKQLDNVYETVCFPTDSCFSKVEDRLFLPPESKL